MCDKKCEKLEFVTKDIATFEHQGVTYLLRQVEEDHFVSHNLRKDHEGQEYWSEPSNVSSTINYWFFKQVVMYLLNNKKT